MKTFGLTTQQALKNKAKGSNELMQRKPESFWSMLKNPCRILGSKF